MTIEQENIIDIVSYNQDNNYVSLIISDHLEWDKNNGKLLKLQNKINSYITFIENGQIYEEYPDSKNTELVIHLSCMYEPDNEGINFLNKVKPIVEEAGYTFVWNTLNEHS